MSNLRKIITNARQDGFRWRVVRGELDLRNGVADTRDDAEAQADAALRDLEANGGVPRETAANRRTRRASVFRTMPDGAPSSIEQAAAAAMGYSVTAHKREPGPGNSSARQRSATRGRDFAFVNARLSAFRSGAKGKTAMFSAIGIVIAFAMIVAPAIVVVGWIQERIERRAIIERRLRGLPGTAAT